MIVATAITIRIFADVWPKADTAEEDTALCVAIAGGVGEGRVTTGAGDDTLDPVFISVYCTVVVVTVIDTDALLEGDSKACEFEIDRLEGENDRLASVLNRLSEVTVFPAAWEHTRSSPTHGLICTETVAPIYYIGIMLSQIYAQWNSDFLTFTH